jgi:hypothetical protein
MLSVADMGREVISQRRKERDQLIMGQGRRRSRVQPPKVRKSTTGDLIKTLDPRRTLRQLRVDPLTQVLDANARQNTPPPIDKPTGTPPIMGPTPPTQQPYSTKTKGSGAVNAGKP